MRTCVMTAAVLAALLLSSEVGRAAPDRSQTVTGTISRIDAERQTLLVRVGKEEMSFLWNTETRINGVLTPEARVSVRYAPQPDGQNLAFQISVGK